MARLVIGLVSVLTTADTERIELHARHMSNHQPGVTVVGRCIPDQPTGVHDEETYQLAAPKVTQLASAFEADGVGAVFVCCAADPGVAEAQRTLRRAVVIGAGSAGATMARLTGRPVGVLGITEAVPDVILRVLGDQLAAYARPEGVRTALDLRGESGYRATIAASDKLVREGAGLILYACTGMSVMGITSELQARHRLPVVDPDLAAASILSYLSGADSGTV